MVKNIKNKIVGNNPLTSKVINQKENIKKIEKVEFRGPSDHGYKTPRNKNLNKSLVNCTTIHPRSSVNSMAVENLSMDMFEVGRKLGKGRFGDVYMARDIKSGFAVAIKVISKKELK